MKIFLILSSIVSFVIAVVLLFTTQTLAASPDGLGPWADSVVSSSQGLMKNGSAVPAIRSNTASALGVAENDTVDGNFFSLGFGGNIVLGFDNGISTGVFIVEATNPDYPLEKVKVEVSENGTTWMNAGTVSQDGSVNVPEQINCAKFIRITDISSPEDFPDDIADGYDVDGAQALGESCTPQSSAMPTPSTTPGPTDTPSNTTTTTTSVPGFPNAGGCTSNGVTTTPNITEARRVSPTSIFLAWGPNGGLNDFVVKYGFSNGNWQFSTHVSGFSTTINDLPANQPIWFEVAATDNCAVGTFGGSVQVGGPGTNVPGFPNTGNRLIPLLPNTGIDPESNSLIVGLRHILSVLFSAFSRD